MGALYPKPCTSSFSLCFLSGAHDEASIRLSSIASRKTVLFISVLFSCIFFNISPKAGVIDYKSPRYINTAGFYNRRQGSGKAAARSCNCSADGALYAPLRRPALLLYPLHRVGAAYQRVVHRYLVEYVLFLFLEFILQFFARVFRRSVECQFAQGHI